MRTIRAGTQASGDLPRSLSRTIIPHINEHGISLQSYQDFLGITAANEESSWLFRSAIKNYHVHSRIFGKWLCSTLGWICQVRAKRAADWQNGFQVHDRIKLFDVAFRQIMKGLREEQQITFGHDAIQKVNAARVRKIFDKTKKNFKDQELHHLTGAFMRSLPPEANHYNSFSEQHYKKSLELAIDRYLRLESLEKFPGIVQSLINDLKRASGDYDEGNRPSS